MIWCWICLWLYAGCSNSSALAMELQQSCTKPWMWSLINTTIWYHMASKVWGVAVYYRSNIMHWSYNLVMFVAVLWRKKCQPALCISAKILTVAPYKSRHWQLCLVRYSRLPGGWPLSTYNNVSIRSTLPNRSIQKGSQNSGTPTKLKHPS